MFLFSGFFQDLGVVLIFHGVENFGFFQVLGSPGVLGVRTTAAVPPT